MLYYPPFMIEVRLDPVLKEALAAIKAAGGRPLLVGGAVRDALMGYSGPVRDADVEVYSLAPDALRAALSKIGQVDAVGASFGVFKLAGLSADFSIPRRDNKVGAGHKGFEVVSDPNLSLKEAAKRRDLTINSMALDPFTGELHDPYGGAEDIKNKVLRATDAGTFLEDPLRAMRVAQFVSRLGFTPNEELSRLCSIAKLEELPGERLLEEWRKLLLGSSQTAALDFVRRTMIRHFPELAATVGCEQDPEYHPEGDVFTHTAMAAEQSRKLTDDETVLWATLLHDAGKPGTTKFEDGRIRSRGHEEAGIEPARFFLDRLKAPTALTDRVAVLVAHHLSPAHFVPDAAHRPKREDAGPAAYRRLARKLGNAGTDLKTLYLVSKADHLGRTTPQALNGEFPSGEEFLRRAQEVQVDVAFEPDVVMGRDLLARGFKPGPGMGEMLQRCREIQYESGLKDVESILKRLDTND